MKRSRVVTRCIMRCSGSDVRYGSGEAPTVTAPLRQSSDWSGPANAVRGQSGTITAVVNALAKRGVEIEDDCVRYIKKGKRAT